MSTQQATEQLQVTGSLLSFNVFEEKLMRNFFIINSKLKKLDDIHELDIKVKALEKESKFISMKLQNIAEKIPKEGGNVTKNDVKMISKESVYDVLNNKDERLMATKYGDQTKKQIQSLKVQLARIRVGGQGVGGLQKKQSTTLPNKASFTAGQVLLQESQGKRIPKDSLQDVLDNSELNIVNDIMGNQEGQGTLIDEINNKFEDVYRRLQEIKLGKAFNEYGEKDIQKFERYEQYEQKSQNAARKNKDKPMRLDGIKRQNVKGEILKNELYAEYQKSQLLKAQNSKQTDKKNIIGKGSNTLTNFKDDKRQIRIFEDGDEKIKRSKSIKKLERIERRLKVDDIKELNSVLKQIQLRIEGKVSHQIFMGLIQDMEEKIEILRVTKDATNDISQLRKMVYSIESRLQAIIIFLQNSVNEDDAFFVKKPWTCASCDKNLEKYGGKVGQHLNWDSMNAKKLSPTKVGAFGQTGQLANKIRVIMENQKGGGE